MFVKLEKLEITNNGHRREFFIREIFVNVDTIVSVSANEDITGFLRNESSLFSDSFFSDVVVATDHKTPTSIIARGSPNSIAESLNGKKKEILHE